MSPAPRNTKEMVRSSGLMKAAPKSMTAATPMTVRSLPGSLAYKYSSKAG